MLKRTLEEEAEAIAALFPPRPDPPAGDIAAYEDLLTGRSHEERIGQHIGQLYRHILRLQDEIEALKKERA